MKLIINAVGLNSLLRQKNKRNKIIVVDVRTFADYAHGHIPGAINIDLMHFHWIDTSTAGISQFNKQMGILFSNLGLAKDKYVIFYEGNSGPSAARGVWLLSYFSHRNVCLLDGGFEKWRKEGAAAWSCLARTRASRDQSARANACSASSTSTRTASRPTGMNSTRTVCPSDARARQGPSGAERCPMEKG